MSGRFDGVKQGELAGNRTVFMTPDKGPKSRLARSQSTHSSVEAG